MTTPESAQSQVPDAEQLVAQWDAAYNRLMDARERGLPEDEAATALTEAGRALDRAGISTFVVRSRSDT